MPPRWRRRQREVDGRAGTNGASDVNSRREADAAFVEHAEEAMLLIDGGVVRSANSAARRLFPLSEDPVGRPVLEVVRDHRIDALIVSARQSNLEQATEVEVPASGRRLQVRAVPGADNGVFVLIQDVTRLRHLEEVRQQFVANLTHEIRTPLAGLDLAAQTLQNQLPRDGEAGMFINRVIQESQRLEAILRNLTHLAALDANTIAVERAPFSAAALVEDLVERYQGRAAVVGLNLRAEIDGQNLAIQGDRTKTDQALQNIVDNALKFTTTGGIILRTSADDSRVEIAVSDTGPGIPPRDLSRIFERFYKVDRSRGGQPGSGLGLSIARHLVELQGGTITAESTPGVGTQVRVRLPRSR